MQIKKILFWNVIFSFITSVFMIACNSQLQSIFGFTQKYVFLGIALWLLSFVMFILYVIFYQINKIIWIKTIICMDFSWVILSIISVLFNLFSISFIGNIIILSVAMIVWVMWILQYIAIKNQL